VYNSHKASIKYLLLSHQTISGTGRHWNMKGTISMGIILTIILLITLALLLAMFYTGSLTYVEKAVGQIIKP